MPLDNSRLQTLLTYLKVKALDTDIAQYAHISRLSLDSRKCSPNTLFLAVAGTQSSGHEYIDNAAQHQCKLAFVDTQVLNQHGVVTQQYVSENRSITLLSIYNLHAKLAQLAYCFYTGFSAQTSLMAGRIAITGVTGTNGKTSVAALIAQLTSLCQHPCATIGTLGVNIFKQGVQHKLGETLNTTPDIVALIGMLIDVEQNGCQRVVLEASSHGLMQNRLAHLSIGSGVFTNLTQDHLDYHKSMASYAKAKRMLLTCDDMSTVVLNNDDEESAYWQQDAKSAQTLYWFSLLGLELNKQGCWATDIQYNTRGISFMLHVRINNVNTSAPIEIALIGAFNVANLLSALTLLIAQGMPFSSLVQACHRVTAVAGRMEIFTSTKATILVDYAHTPDALKQALLAARVHTKGTLTCIFGCGGNRDVSKRPIMGAIAKQYADNIVLTQDNSRNEAPSAIITDIRAGINVLNENQHLHIELDRERAITVAWQASKAGDIILVAGKGHEDYIEIANQRIAYNERETVQKLLAGEESHLVGQASNKTKQQRGVQ